MKKLIVVLMLGLVLVSPTMTQANTILELEDGSHFFYNDIDYGTTKYIMPYEYAEILNNNFNDVDELNDYLRKDNNATSHAQVLNSYSKEEMMEYFKTLNNRLESEADRIYYTQLLKEYLLNNN